MKTRFLTVPVLLAATLAACERRELTGPTCRQPQVAIPAVPGDTVTLPDGVKYLEIRPGGGEAALATSTVVVNYDGYLRDGTVFDSGIRVLFDLEELIPGFRTGITGLQEGGARRIIIPPAQGYGAAGRGACIPGNATLIFDVLLHEVL